MNRSRIPITTGLVCPCCGQPTRRQWVQPSLLPDRPGHSQTDCLNRDCAGYYMTLSVEEFINRYGRQPAASCPSQI